MTGYKGFFNVTDKNNKFYFAKTITDKDGFVQITIPQGAYELQSLRVEVRQHIIDEGRFTEVAYPFTIKSNFSTVGNIIEISREETLISFLPDDSIRILLGLNASTLSEEVIFIPNTDEILSFNNIFLECNIAQGMIFKSKLSGRIHTFTLEVVPAYIYTLKEPEKEYNGI